MVYRNSLVALLPAVVLAACSTDMAAPGKTVTGPSFSVSTAASGTYMVLMTANAIPADFAARVTRVGGTVTYANPGAGVATVSGITGSGAAQLAGSRGVADVESDAAFTLDTPLAAAEADATATADETIASVSNPASAALFSWQWNMSSIGANTAWAAGHLGAVSITAAILDTGIDYDSRDLNGLVDLSRSVSFAPSDDALVSTMFPGRDVISDLHGHGTNVASQVSSKARFLAGVTSKTTLIGVKVLNAHGSGFVSGVLNGILWAADNGANVANMSLGGGFAKAANGRFVALISRVMNYAKQKGMLIVVAAGNDGADIQHEGNFYTTYCDAVQVVCVSAAGPVSFTSDPSVPAFYTNFGRGDVDVAGPGGNAAFDSDGNIIVSAWPWGDDIASWVWSFCSKTRLVFDANNNPATTSCIAGNRLRGFIGTSQATPHVTGLAASLIAELGSGRAAFVKQRIIQSARSSGGQAGVFGRGEVNVAAAFGL